VSAQLDKDARLDDLREPKRRHQMTSPGSRTSQAQRLPEEFVTDLKTLNDLMNVKGWFDEFHVLAELLPRHGRWRGFRISPATGRIFRPD